MVVALNQKKPGLSQDILQLAGLIFKKKKDKTGEKHIMKLVTKWSNTSQYIDAATPKMKIIDNEF